MGEDGINVVGRLPVLFSEKCFHDVLWSYMIYFSSVKELWLVYMFFVLFFSCVLVLWRTALKLRVESCRKKVIESKRAWKIELWCLFRLHPATSFHAWPTEKMKGRRGKRRKKIGERRVYTYMQGQIEMICEWTLTSIHFFCISVCLNILARSCEYACVCELHIHALKPVW